MMAYQSQNAVTHGMSYTSTYRSWLSMRNRCYRKGSEKYPMYGAKGIKVCKRWRNSFENFLEDMGERPEGMTLDRIDGTKGYSPSNCRWATPTQQARNTRIRKDNTTGVKGVGFCKAQQKYVARIVVNKKTIRLGSYTNLEDAKAARLKAEELYW